ncbi:aminoglycoside phosphotransferase family protein [bacterium]|nr:aminoglycoside phosphotransferase family protein [bacterium]
MTQTHRPKHNLKEVTGAFDLPGAFAGAHPYGSGHINDTYLARIERNGTATPFIIQRINHLIFTEPEMMMDNIVRVSAHLARTQAAQPAPFFRAALSLVPRRDGGCLYRDSAGNYWRVYHCIHGAHSHDVVQGTDHAYEAARAFGAFIVQLADLDGARLHDTIPYFHHTPHRFEQLEAAIATDVSNRAAAVKPEIAFAMARKPMTPVLLDLLAKGLMRECVTHNDTKINNVLMDDATNRAACVIDLDTVMPGLPLYDFGDCVRSTSMRAAEDETDISKVTIDLGIFEALARGFLEQTRDFLLPAEIEHLPFSARLITFEIGIRFLADYLNGDVYFKTHRPGQNLDRARTQFALVASMEQHDDEMMTIVRKYS